LYDVEGNVSSQKHLDWFNDFVYLEEVDYEDAKMRLFAQSLKVKSENGLELSQQQVSHILKPLKQVFLQSGVTRKTPFSC
jgi:hypothetical protein